jgi:hypothetical protein
MNHVDRRKWRQCFSSVGSGNREVLLIFFSFAIECNKFVSSLLSLMFPLHDVASFTPRCRLDLPTVEGKRAFQESEAACSETNF